MSLLVYNYSVPSKSISLYLLHAFNVRYVACRAFSHVFQYITHDVRSTLPPEFSTGSSSMNFLDNWKRCVLRSSAFTFPNAFSVRTLTLPVSYGTCSLLIPIGLLRPSSFFSVAGCPWRRSHFPWRISHAFPRMAFRVFPFTFSRAFLLHFKCIPRVDRYIAQPHQALVKFRKGNQSSFPTSPAILC